MKTITYELRINGKPCEGFRTADEARRMVKEYFYGEDMAHVQLYEIHTETTATRISIYEEDD